MKTNYDVVDTINKVFNDENYLLSILDSKRYFDDDNLYEVLAITLNYYLLTHDKIVNYSGDEIQDKYRKINSYPLNDEQIKNIINLGYLTHSFCGVEKEYIEKYGFDYWDKISESKRKQLEFIRNGLCTLEKELGKSEFVTFREEKNPIDIVEKEVYMTVPGTKTIYYSQNAPERFLLGPIGCDSFDYFPMVVGESKKDYLMRILKYRIEKLTYNVDQDELLAIADRIVDYYTKEKNCISFINIKDIIDIPVYTVNYGNGNEETLRKYCRLVKFGHLYAENALTNKKGDEYEEPYDVGNLVTLSNFIPKTALSFASFPDTYNLKQLYLKQKGIKDGVPVTYYKCQELESNNDLPEEIKKLYK